MIVRDIDLEEIQRQKEKYPLVPTDYFDFLSELGVGAFRECSYNVYSHLGTLADFGSAHLFPSNPNVLIFGDNFSGDFGAFNVDNHYSVVELWHDSGNVYETNLSFEDFIEDILIKDDDDLYFVD